MTYECPSCRTELAFRELNFGQNVSFARFWFRIEGAAFGRLHSQFLDGLSKRLGLPLVVVPEVIDDQAIRSSTDTLDFEDEHANPWYWRRCADPIRLHEVRQRGDIMLKVMAPEEHHLFP